MTKLISDEQRTQLLANGRQSNENPDFDPMPAVKLFTPDAGATWLLTEIDPGDETHGFGLCDLRHGFPELGYVSLEELEGLRGTWVCALSAIFTSSPSQSAAMRVKRGWWGASWRSAGGSADCSCCAYAQAVSLA